MDERRHTQLPSMALIRSVANGMGREAGYRLIVLFGSAARGEPFEDLDIGILHDDPLDTVALTNTLTTALGFQRVDVCELRRADPLLLQLVARDGLPLFDASGHEFARFASLAARRFADTRKFRELERERIRDFVARRDGTS